MRGGIKPKIQMCFTCHRQAESKLPFDEHASFPEGHIRVSFYVFMCMYNCQVLRFFGDSFNDPLGLPIFFFRFTGGGA